MFRLFDVFLLHNHFYIALGAGILDFHSDLAIRVNLGNNLFRLRERWMLLSID